MLSFYWLDREDDTDVKRSFSLKDTDSLKPSIKIDCDYSQVPLYNKNIKDIETDVWTRKPPYVH